MILLLQLATKDNEIQRLLDKKKTPAEEVPGRFYSKIPANTT